ncbi:MAG: polysaccharide lyase family protein, partial [Candidatus Omnitrophota bacterium]
ITEGNNLTAIINETAAYYAVMAKPESLAVEIGDKKAKTVEGKGRINNGYIYKSDKYIKIIQDNKWHQARFDIKKALSKFTNCAEIEELIIADWDSLGYMELRPGINKKDKYFYLANVELNRYNDRKREDKNPGLWEIGIEDNDAGEFVFEKDAEKDYNIGQPYDRYARAITPGEPTSKIKFNLTEEQTKRYYRLIIKAISVDTSKKGYVKFAVLLNDNKLAEYNAAYWQGQRFNIPIHEHLQIGKNTIKLQWLDGGDWISWDYLEFIQDN